MVREWAAPTLFLTFSCAEYESPDIARYLRKVNHVPDSYPIGKLCCEDPVSVSHKFSQKFHTFFNTVILKKQVLGIVEHYFFKKEYQTRGAPHYHAVIWIQNAPIIGKDHQQVVMPWITDRITCHFPEENTNPELHKLVTRYQRHKCSRYCKRTRKFGKTFVTTCKFGFPREASETGFLHNVEDCLKSGRKIYSLPRTESETPSMITIPFYSCCGRQTWTYIQFVAEHSLALAHYVTGYVTEGHENSTCPCQAFNSG